MQHTCSKRWCWWWCGGGRWVKGRLNNVKNRHYWYCVAIANGIWIFGRLDQGEEDNDDHNGLLQQQSVKFFHEAEKTNRAHHPFPFSSFAAATHHLFLSLHLPIVSLFLVVIAMDQLIGLLPWIFLGRFYWSSHALTLFMDLFPTFSGCCWDHSLGRF